MAEALKHFYGDRVIRSIGRDLARVHPTFDERAFVRAAMRGLEPLSLTERAAHISTEMQAHLPHDYEDAVRILLASLGSEHGSSQSFGMEPFRYLPHTLFVSRLGLDSFELSMRALYELTKRFTAEAAIRPFLVRHPERTYERLREWATDPDVHVRRLVSEGTRPRLPWAMRLRAFQEDPRPVIALLELLKDDPERYVQRSVANNLNDIAKDHPDIAVEVCARWSKKAPPARAWIVKHSLRSLLKAGNRGALTLMGVAAAPKVEVRGVEAQPKRVKIGAKATIAFELLSRAKDVQDLLVDYAVYFVKANGKASAKVFKLRRVKLGPRQSTRLVARISFAELTTRKPYPGIHRVELRINGAPFPLTELDLRR